MKALIQRVENAHVTVDNRMISHIGQGILVLLGVARGDTQKEADYLVEKILHLRIFEDDQGKMNRSLMDVGGDLLVVSQFTLLGDCRKGRRPSFVNAADPKTASQLYDYFAGQAAARGVTTQTGQFQAMMNVSLVNQGPVTLMLESKPA